MRRVAGVAVLAALAHAASGCGGSGAHPKSADEVAAAGDGGAADGGAGDAGGPSVCTGPDLDLVNVLVQSACEVANPPADTKSRDVSALLDVKVTTIPSDVARGAHADVFVTFTNKSSEPLSLDFLLDPLPRFTVEAYTSSNRRADQPSSSPPRGKNGAPPAEPTAPGTARITITPGGKARAKVGWDAVRTRWAPELLKGTPPEQGYPTAPVGPLPKGKYTLKVITPLVGVFEGSDHEVSTAKTTITVQ